MQIFQLVCESFALVGLLVVVFLMRRSARYNEITRKLYAREPLTDREQRLLDKTGDRT